MFMLVPIAFEHNFEHVAVSPWPDQHMHRVVDEMNCPRIPVGMHNFLVARTVAAG